ncbi:ABC transporter permease [Spiribacter halobius]|uniref:Transport permease protein n=1 Tax=Sediminicurvatus halobius TaxID=2182432 RepID=A0A2U2MY44_9GAMM|nr:ABC transporter permease [Spiribacter halobius]PWG61713.1 ABC transporter permease [Spiribacter halobius]UEX77337.1 ABC transporter permease [Spiribacter halobius]
MTAEEAAEPGTSDYVRIYHADDRKGLLRSLQLLIQYRELMLILAWKEISVRYKQAYLGLFWAVLKPALMTAIFTIVKSFVGIDTGNIPYPIMAFAALLPWIFFQESVNQGVNSVVSNAALVRKIYFPREIFPITATLTKVVELAISFVLLATLMVIYQMPPTVHFLWVPLIILYTIIVALSVSTLGAALNVYYRDVRTALPLIISMLMYVSPIIYPMDLVQRTLLENQAAGALSGTLYFLYTMNPLAGIIDGFQGALLRGEAPELAVLLPGMLTTAVLLPISYYVFKRAEQRFADFI